jgi:RNA polymerase sigma-70 factor, ECF subfamily
MSAKMGNSVPLALSETMPTSDAASLEMEAAVRESSRLVYKISYSVLGNHHDAEDAAQETFFRYFRHRNDWPEIRDRRAWLARVAWRVALDHRRTAPEIPLGEAIEAVGELKAAGAGPEEIAAGREMQALLGQLIETLPKDLRDAVWLSSAEELSSAEVGEILGIPEGSVRERLWRARKILKEKLTRVLGGSHGQ